MKVAVRPLLVFAVMGLLATSGVAAQAAPAACNLVKDVRGDATQGRAVVNDAALDIISADVASNGSRITGVIRLDDVTAALTDSQLAPRWSLSFEVGKVRYLMRAIPFRGKVVGSSGVVEPDTGHEQELQTVSAVIDQARNEVRITSPVRDFAASVDLRPGTVLRNLQVHTYRVANFGLGRVEALRDDATGKSYTAGSRSCVTVGS